MRASVMQPLGPGDQVTEYLAGGIVLADVATVDVYATPDVLTSSHCVDQ